MDIQTYDSTHKLLNLTDIYDLASVTKVFATNLAVMKLHDEQRHSVFLIKFQIILTKV